MELKKSDFKKFRIVDQFFYALPVSFFDEKENAVEVIGAVIGKAVDEIIEETAEEVVGVKGAIISETKTGNKRAIIGYDPSDIPAINKTIDKAIEEEVKPTKEELAEIEKQKLIKETQDKLAKLLGE